MRNFLALAFPFVLACSSSPAMMDGGGMVEDAGSSAPDSNVADSGPTALPMNKWTAIAFPSSAEVYSVWAEAKDKVWIGADDGFYESKDGRTFKKIDLGMPLSIRDVNPDIFLAPYARAAGSSGASRVVLEYNPDKETWPVFDWSANY